MKSCFRVNKSPLIWHDKADTHVNKTLTSFPAILWYKNSKIPSKVIFYSANPAAHHSLWQLVFIKNCMELMLLGWQWIQRLSYNYPWLPANIGAQSPSLVLLKMRECVNTLLIVHVYFLIHLANPPHVSQNDHYRPRVLFSFSAHVKRFPI